MSAGAGITSAIRKTLHAAAPHCKRLDPFEDTRCSASTEITLIRYASAPQIRTDECPHGPGRPSDVIQHRIVAAPLVRALMHRKAVTHSGADHVQAMVRTMCPQALSITE